MLSDMTKQLILTALKQKLFFDIFIYRWVKKLAWKVATCFNSKYFRVGVFFEIQWPFAKKGKYTGA